MEQDILDFIAKAQYKIGELGASMMQKTSRTIRVVEEDYILMRDLMAFIKTLYESDLTIEGNDFNFLTDDAKTLATIEEYRLRANLDVVPIMSFPKQQTIIEGPTIIYSGEGGGGTLLPSGGGPGFYLTKNASGSLIWKEFDILTSNFDSL